MKVGNVLFCAVVCMSSSCRCEAQATRWMGTAQQVAALTKELPPEARTTLDRLQGLHTLPPEPWKYTAAELPHGERVDLDDSGWSTIAGDSQTHESGWFRTWVRVPSSLQGYDLAGSQVWLTLRLGRASFLAYVDGKHVAAGEDEEPILLLDNARPGDKALVAIKLIGVDTPSVPTNASVKIQPVAGRPSPEVFREECLDLTALLSDIAEPKGKETLLAALATVDLKALDRGDQAGFDASLRSGQALLEPLQTSLRRFTIVETGNSHIDAAWLWPWVETVDVVHRTFSTALQLMHEYPAYTYTQSAAQYNEWMAEKYPEVDSEIQQRVREGRWEVVGGMWVEPDLNMPDGESIARSILIGKRWYKQHYGVDVHIGWNPDSFGYNWQLPQIYKRSGIDFFVTQKMEWNDTNRLPFKLFWWESPDGSKVLTYFPHIYGNRNLDPVRVGVDLAHARVDLPPITEMMDLYGVSDHGGGATRAVLDEGTQWVMPDKVVPRTRFGTAASFFADVLGKITSDSPEWDYARIAAGFVPPMSVQPDSLTIPTWKDEMYLEYHRGIFTSQADFKQGMRRSSEETLDAEQMSTIAMFSGELYPSEQLLDAWKKVTFNQFHDIAAGSGVAAVYKDAQRDYNEVRGSTKAITTKAMEAIAATVDTRGPNGVPIFVYNTLSWSRSGVIDFDVELPQSTNVAYVTDSRSRVIPSEILSVHAATRTLHMRALVSEVPSIGYEVLHVYAGSRPIVSDLKIAGTTMENANLRVTVDPGSGCITSLFEKRNKFETIAPHSCGNELEAFIDKPEKFDAWNIDPGTLDAPPVRLVSVESVRLIEDSAVRSVIRVQRKWQASTFTQDVILYANSDEVVIANEVDWHERHTLLKAAFTLSASSPIATYEIPYGTIQRPTTRNNSWEKARFEVPALQWADLGDRERGFSLLNDSKYGYDAVGNTLRLSLLRAPTYPDPEADQGRHRFSYGLYPHAGDWSKSATIRRGYEFNFGLCAQQVTPHAGLRSARDSFLSLDRDNVVITAVKKAEDSNALVVHMYEWAGTRSNVHLAVPAGVTAAVETNLMEQPSGPQLVVRNHRVEISVRPYEIVSLKLDVPSLTAGKAEAK